MNTINDVLPEDVKSVLAALAYKGDSSLWAIGRMARDLAIELPVSRNILDQAIAQACGWKSSRARDVRSVATYYPNYNDNKYSVLSFSHFRTAMSAQGLDKSFAWLNWCLTSADDYGGQPAPVDVLAAKMRDAGDKIAMPLHEKWLAQVGRLLDKLYVHSSTPPGIKTKLEAVMIAFDKAFTDIGDQQ